MRLARLSSPLRCFASTSSPSGWFHSGGSAPKSPRYAIVIAVVLSFVATAGCGGDSTDIATSDGSGSPDRSESSDPSTTADDGTTTTGASAPTSAPKPPAALDDASSVTRSAEPSEEGMQTARLIGVRVGNHSGYERVVFEFEGSVPGYEVGYFEVPPVEDGSGEPIEVSGSNVLSVRMFPASGFRFVDEGVEPTYTGSRRVAGAGSPVTEAVRGGDFEAQLTWFVGVEGRNPFVVSTTKAPARIIIDIAAS